jgi:hypothetical protein
MAKTAAQRQAEYRKRQDRGDGHRLNCWIDSDRHFALKRLARRYGVTKLEIIERLAVAEENRILAGIELDSPEWNAYFGVTQ